MRGIIEQPRRSQAQPSQVVAALLRALFGSAVTGKHVLLHDNPAVVALASQRVNDGAELHDAGAKLAEQLRTDGNLPPNLAFDPLFEPLRGDPRFAAYTAPAGR